MTPQQQKQFLAVLARTGKVDRAAARAGVPRSTVYRYRTRDAAFAKAWDTTLGDCPRRPASAPVTLASPPGRLLNVEDLTPEQRRKARDFLASLAEVPPGTAAQLAQAALERWLAGESWRPLDEGVVHELRHLSPRAADDYAARHPANELPTVLGDDGM